MWRSPLRVALVLLLGLTCILLVLGSYPTQAVTAEPLEPTSTPVPTVVRNVNVRVEALTDCPGDWTVTNIQSPSSPSFTLRISDATRFINSTCRDIRVGDTLQVRGTVPLGQPTITLLTALAVVRVGTPPTPATAQTITFRGTIIGNPRPVSGGYDVQFNTEVSGALTVTIPSALLGGVVPQRGDKADVTAQRQNNAWLATRVQFVSATSDVGFSGLIEIAPNTPPYYGQWKIAGRWLTANASTTITGIPKPYRRAVVVAEAQGSNLRAKSIVIDATEAPATAFELAGIASITEGNPTTASSRLGCLPFTLDPGASLPAGITDWRQLTSRSVSLSGSRSLGVTSLFKAESVTLLSVPFGSIAEVEIQGYVDLRQVNQANGEVQLQIGRVVIRVPNSLPNVDAAVQGTVVRVRGTCTNVNVDNNLTASSIVVVSQPYVAFSGTIAALETESGDVVGFQIRPAGSNDLQHIRRDIALPFVGGNDPVVGGCLSGYGYYLGDGSIQAQRIEVIGCAPSKVDRLGDGSDDISGG